MAFSQAEVYRIRAPFDDVSRELSVKLLDIAAGMRKVENSARGYTVATLKNQRARYARLLQDTLFIQRQLDRHMAEIEKLIAANATPFDEILYKSYLECKLLMDELNIVFVK